jgi:hypothetical protein
METAIEAQGEAPPAPSGNFLARHWRGGYSLGISYWLIGLLGQAAGVAIITLLALSVAKARSPWGAAITWAMTWLIIAAVTVWQAVGVWRSARRHVSSTGRAFWARAAQVATVLGVIRVTAEFFSSGLPAMQEGVAQARWLAKHGRWELRSINDGQELEITGGIGFGFAKDLKVALDGAPKLRVVHLNVPMGGLIDEAKEAGALIRARGLWTYTAAACVSACTVVFLGGAKRYLRTGARLGFHAPRSPGASGLVELQMRGAEERYFMSAGVTKAFAARVVGTAHKDMWFPTERELLEAGVVSEITSGDQFALSGLGRSPTLESLDEGLQKERVFRVLKASRPEAYQSILEAELGAWRKGQSVEQLRAVTIPVVARVVSESLAYSSDEALLRYGKLMASQLAALEKAPPKVCRDQIAGTGSGAAASWFSERLRAEELEVEADIIQSVDRSRKPVAPATLQASLQKAFAKARATSGNDVEALSQLNDPNADPKAVCRAASVFYGAIVALPAEDAAVLLRGLNAN